MRLDRLNGVIPARQKYALIKLREGDPVRYTFPNSDGTINTVLAVKPSSVDFGDTDETEFFVIRLKDKFAAPALFAYAMACQNEANKKGLLDLLDFAGDVRHLAVKAAAMPGKLPT